MMDRFDFEPRDGNYYNIVAHMRDGGLWVKYEDVKGLELQVATLTEQLSKMERKPTENEIIDKIQALNLKPNDILVVKLGCQISLASRINLKRGISRTLTRNGFENDIFIVDDIADLKIVDTLDQRVVISCQQVNQGNR